MEFVIVCSEKGIIQEIIQDSTKQLTVGNSLFPFVDSFSIPKILTFYQELENKGSALNWEINFCVEEHIVAFVISGMIRKDEMQIFGYTTSDETDQVINRLSELSNEQSTLLRSSIKENIKNKVFSSKQDDLEVLNSLKNENKWLKKQLIEVNQISDKQIESKLISCNKINQQLVNSREKLELIYDELVYSVDLITEDYTNKKFSKQKELEEISNQLNLLNELIVDFPQTL